MGILQGLKNLYRSMYETIQHETIQHETIHHETIQLKEQNMKCIKILGSVVAILFAAATVNADIVEFDFETDDTANPDFALALDTAPDFTATQDGITFTASATSTDGVTVPNTAGSGLGVNSSVDGDQASSIDPGEILTLTITFDPAAFLSVQLANIDLSNTGGATDGAVVGLPNGTTVTLSLIHI